MTGRHRADRLAEAPTAPMPVVQPGRPGLAGRLIAELRRRRLERAAQLDAEAEDWLRMLRTGGTRTARRISRTLRQRGLMLAKRTGRQARRLRTALAREGRA